MSTNTSTERWYCQITIGTPRKDRRGIEHQEIKATLMFGGMSFHTLTGPTAKRSIEEFAEHLNAKGQEPNRNQPKCFADIAGWEAVSRKKHLAMNEP